MLRVNLFIIMILLGGLPTSPIPPKATTKPATVDARPGISPLPPTASNKLGVRLLTDGRHDLPVVRWPEHTRYARWAVRK